MTIEKKFKSFIISDKQNLMSVIIKTFAGIKRFQVNNIPDNTFLKLV